MKMEQNRELSVKGQSLTSPMMPSCKACLLLCSNSLVAPILVHDLETQTFFFKKTKTRTKWSQ